VLDKVIDSKQSTFLEGMRLLDSVEEETVSHLFFECRISWRIRGLCLEWLEFSSILHCDAQFHFKLFKPIGLKQAFVSCWGDWYYR